MSSNGRVSFDSDGTWLDCWYGLECLYVSIAIPIMSTQSILFGIAANRISHASMVRTVTVG